MRNITRYSNRKLYDRHAKVYATLEDIAGLIRRGEKVRVTDNETGEDITTVVLSEVILERERRREGFLPGDFFTEIIRKGEEFKRRLTRGAKESIALFDKALTRGVGDALKGILVPSRKDIERLKEKIRALEKKVEQLEGTTGKRKIPMTKSQIPRKSRPPNPNRCTGELRV